MGCVDGSGSRCYLISLYGSGSVISHTWRSIMQRASVSSRFIAATKANNVEGSLWPYAADPTAPISSRLSHAVRHQVIKNSGENPGGSGVSGAMRSIPSVLAILITCRSSWGRCC
jgi:hypothetical protein